MLRLKEPSPVTRALIEFLQLPGIGVATARQFTDFNGCTLEDWVTELQLRKPGNRNFDSQQIEAARRVAQSQIERCSSLDIDIVGFTDAAYPRCLAAISDFPPLLYVKGNAYKLAAECVAVVGTRHATDAGIAIAKKIATVLVQRNITVVSGLALGIDAAAHEAVLEAGGVTLAVLAHGLDTISPSRNRQLASLILESEGLLVSEHPPGTPPRPPEFVRRNRIQSGLSKASIIVESGEKGGSIHQARFTVSQRRKLYVAWPTDDVLKGRQFKFEGARLLIDREGAIRITSARHFGEELDRLEPQMRFATAMPAESATPPKVPASQIELF